jgi:hypothetical protein
VCPFNESSNVWLSHHRPSHEGETYTETVACSPRGKEMVAMLKVRRIDDGPKHEGSHQRRGILCGRLPVTSSSSTANQVTASARFKPSTCSTKCQTLPAFYSSMEYQCKIFSKRLYVDAVTLLLARGNEKRERC